MTVPVSTGKAGPYTGNGVATSFTFDFKVLAKADLRVVLTLLSTGAETDLVLDSDYSVTLNADQVADPGGSITYPLSGDPMANTHSLTAIGDLTVEQPIDITNAGAFYPDVIEKGLDRIVMLVRQIVESVSRSLKLAVSTPDGVSADLPAPVANQVLGWNADGTGFKNFAPVDNTLLAAALAAPSGSSVLGHIDPGPSAVETTIAEIFARTVSVYDFMTPAERTDFLSGAPALDHAPAFNRAITVLKGAGRVSAPRKRTGKYRFASTINLGTSTAADSNIVIDFEPGVEAQCVMPNLADNVFSIVNFPGHFNYQGIKNLKATSTNGNGRLMKFNGQCWGSFTHIYAEGFSVGVFISNEGSGIFNEFIEFNQLELHLNTTGILMMKDGDSAGTDTSMHGISFRNTSINVGSGQAGYQNIDACWYNGTADFHFFSSAASDAIIKVQANAPTANKGVFVSGQITCEGDAAIKGNGRFWVKGRCNFDLSLTDTLASPDAWEQGFMCDNYIKGAAYGSSGLNAAEVLPKSLQYGTTGPIGSFARLSGSNVEALLANSYSAHTINPGNGFYTGYTGYQQGYGAGILGHFLSSDGTEFKTFAPTSTQCAFKHNEQYIIRFDGSVKANSVEGFLIGSGAAGEYSGVGSPEGSFSAGVGTTYRDRSGGANTTFYVKESGSGNTGWVAK